MTQQIINLGSSANDGTGDPLRTGGQKINANFTEVYSGNYTATVTTLPTTNIAGVPTVYSNQVTFENVNASAPANLMYGTANIYNFQGQYGSRRGLSNFVGHLSPSNIANTSHVYTSLYTTMYSGGGDNGTNLGAGALGEYFGAVIDMVLNTGATNVFESTGLKINVTVPAGASAKLVEGISNVGHNAVQGVYDAAYSIGGASPHIGWKLGLAWTDVDGVSPVGATSVLIGSYFPTIGVQTVSKGVDFSGFTFTSNAFASTGFNVDGLGNVGMLSLFGTQFIISSFAALALTNTAGLNSDLSVTKSKLRISNATGNFSVGGFICSLGFNTDGTELFVYNSTANTMTIVNEDASSTATNRIKTLTGGNVALRAGATSCASFIWNGTDGRWILQATN